MKKLLMLAVMGVVGLTQAGEEWSGSNLTIYGDTDGTVYVKSLEDEILNAGWLKLGTEQGSAALNALDSTILLTGNFYLGNQVSPGYSTMTSRLSLTNSSLTCTTFYTGYDGAGNSDLDNERCTVDLGPGSVISNNVFKHYATPYARIDFRGGRLVSLGTSDRIFTVSGHTYAGGWPNTGIILKGCDAPIDVEINNDRMLVAGNASRRLNLRGNGGFIKRGTGLLKWGWHTEGSNNGFINRTVDYSGDTIVKAGGIRVSTYSTAEKAQVANDTSPNSTLVVEDGASFDVNGEKVNFLGVSGGGLVTNGAATAGTFVLCAKGDGVYAPAKVGGLFNVVKVGNDTTLTASDTTVPGLFAVSNGMAKVTAGTALTADVVRVCSGATLDVRGATLVCRTLDVEKGGTFLSDGQTHLDAELATDEPLTCFGGLYAGSGTFKKSGAGALTMYGTCEKNGGRVEVDEGSVLVKAQPLFTGKYFRFVFKQTAVTSDVHYVNIGEMSLYDVAGIRINKGPYTYNRIQYPGTTGQQVDGIVDGSVLAEKEVAVWGKGSNYFMSHYDNGGPDMLFDGNPETPFTPNWTWRNSGAVFRLPDDAPAVLGYTFTTDKTPGNRIVNWLVYGSADGKNWVELDVVTNDWKSAEAREAAVAATPSTAKTEYNGGFPYLLNKLSATADYDYAPFGISGTVAVANDASLDLEAAAMQIGRLEVDCTAGSGSITRFTPAADGALYLVNVPAGQELVGYEPPIAIGAIGDDANFRTWKVYVGGVERNDLRVRWRNGKLTILAKGLYLFVR